MHLKRIKTLLALIRKYGLRKTLIAYHESSSDRNWILTDCPKCSTEHRIHRLRASRDMIRCSNCRTYFVVMKRTVEESAFMKAFGGKGR